MKQLPCIKQYILGKRLKTLITMTNTVYIRLVCFIWLACEK